MWNLMQKPAPVLLSEKLVLHLGKERGLSREAAGVLRMMQERGQYVGRKVTFFRIYDPAKAQAAGIDVRRFNDVDGHLMLHAGHVEADGQVVLNLKARED